MMDKKNIDNLTKIMDQEIQNFKQLLKYEKLKNSVIINHEIEKLKKLSSDEEEILDKVVELEKEREIVVKELYKKYHVKEKKVLSSLLKVLPDDDNTKDDLKEKKNELVRNIKDLKRINEINNKLMKDSIKFFNYAVNSIQELDAGIYDQTGTMPTDYETPGLINKQA